MNYHEPVLLQEVINGLKVSKGERFIDATLGGGGHTKAMLELGAEVLSIDADPDAITNYELRMTNGEMRKNLRVVQGNFRNIKEIAHLEAFYPVSGILFDLGVSSHQLDSASRGFSYRFGDAPFDLRLNQEEGVPASDLVNRESEEELKRIIGVFGEEELCGRIAHALVQKRAKKRIETTGEVLTIISEELGAERPYKTASKVFQGFRIAVNDELNSLKIGLEKSVDLIKPGGRIAVISFHSLEDRIVKLFFQKKGFSIITKKPIIAGSSEQRLNRRSRSAKLRIGEKI